MVEGGVWTRPGPSLSVAEGFEGLGRASLGIISPGRRSVSGTITNGKIDQGNCVQWISDMMQRSNNIETRLAIADLTGAIKKFVSSRREKLDDHLATMTSLSTACSSFPWTNP